MTSLTFVLVVITWFALVVATLIYVSHGFVVRAFRRRGTEAVIATPEDWAGR